MNPKQGKLIEKKLNKNTTNAWKLKLKNNIQGPITVCKNKNLNNFYTKLQIFDLDLL